MRKKCLPVFFCLLLLLPPGARAMSQEEVLAHDREIADRWVNWVPADWERDGDVAALAAQLAAGDPAALPERVHRWICENIRYDWDAFEAGTYSTLSPASVLAEGRGVCEGIANLVQALFLEAGVPCIKVWGVAITEDQSWEAWDTSRINHTWNEYYWAGTWTSMDCTMDLQNGPPYRAAYLAPEPAFFARTHLVLRRGEGGDAPDPWALAEVTEAVDRGLVPLDLLRRYRAPVTERELLALLGRSGGEERPLTRLEAALLLAEGLETGGTAPYIDTGHLPADAQAALAALYRLDILHGSGGRFCPNDLFTRQEAAAVLARCAR